MSASKLLRVIGLAIIMLVSLVGQGQAQGQEPPLAQPAWRPAGQFQARRAPCLLWSMPTPMSTQPPAIPPTL